MTNRGVPARSISASVSRHGSSRGFVVLVAVVVLSCGSEDASVPEWSASQRSSEARVVEPPVASPSPSLGPGREAPPLAATAPQGSEPSPGGTRSLEDLLRLPDSAVEVDPVAERLKGPKPEVAEGAGDAQKARRLQPELETSTESSVVHPSKSRTRTDAGVSVDVGETTKLRGGVRVEQESGEEREAPMPKIGIEQRF